MSADFSPKMLRGFLHARIEMAGYRVMFPDERKSTRRPAPSFDEAKAAERAKIMRRAEITQEQLDAALSAGTVCRAARERLWKALGADPASFGVRLIGGFGQEKLP